MKPIRVYHASSQILPVYYIPDWQFVIVFITDHQSFIVAGFVENNEAEKTSFSHEKSNIIKINEHLSTPLSSVFNVIVWLHVPCVLDLITIWLKPLCCEIRTTEADRLGWLKIQKSTKAAVWLSRIFTLPRTACFPRLKPRSARNCTDYLPACFQQTLWSLLVISTPRLAVLRRQKGKSKSSLLFPPTELLTKLPDSGLVRP